MQTSKTLHKVSPILEENQPLSSKVVTFLPEGSEITKHTMENIDFRNAHKALVLIPLRTSLHKLDHHMKLLQKAVENVGF